MSEKRTAVLTICRDDLFFLDRFVKYYGGLFGRDSVYVISHGDEADVRKIAQGCNIFPIPAVETNKFTMLKSRTLNHLKDALRQWYTHVIVVDVDEFLVVDPSTGLDLRTWLDTAPDKTVYTAMGMEVLHMRSKEDAPVKDGILGPRMFAQVSLHYAKPCIISRPTKLARGGHYSEFEKLNLPDFLYLFHMKYCDYDVFADQLNRRATFVAEQQKHGEVRSNPQWFAKDRDDGAVFAAFEARPKSNGFDLSKIRAGMHDSWEKRNKDGMWHFHRPDFEQVFRLPDRFAGLDQG